MVIAHEADSLRYVRPGITRNQLFAILLERDSEFAAVERRWNGFDYSLPGLDQGRFTRLRVIGDKHAGRAARRLRDEPELLDRLRAVADVPIRVLHITRNPFDNIASIARNRELPLAQAIEIYRDLGVAVDGVRALLSRDELLDLSYESILRDPGGGDLRHPALHRCRRVIRVRHIVRIPRRSRWPPRPCHARVVDRRAPPGRGDRRVAPGARGVSLRRLTRGCSPVAARRGYKRAVLALLGLAMCELKTAVTENQLGQHNWNKQTGPLPCRSGRHSLLSVP